MRNINKILVVDDDKATLDLIKRYNKTLGIETDCYLHPVEALKQDMTKYDFIVLDYMMSGINGIEFLKTIRACGYTMPVIMMTAINDAAVVDNAFQLGICNYLVKPIFYDTYKDVVEKLVAAKENQEIKNDIDKRIKGIFL